MRRYALRVLGWVALLAALLAAAGAMLPLSPTSLREGFFATLHFGVATGTPLISTFGPLGFLFYPLYYPTTYAWLFGLRAALAGATCATLAWIGYAAWDGPWGAALAVGGCAPFLAVDDVWFTILPLLAALIDLPRRPAPAAVRIALGTSIGVAALIKFTFFIAAAVVLIPVTVAALLARRLPVVTTAAVIAAAFAWRVTGHGWADWLAYLDWSREIATGYSGAMQLPFDPPLARHVAAVSAAVLAAAALLAWQRLRWACWALVLALAAMLFLLFKAGFVRADVHVYITCFGLLVISLLLALLWGCRARRVLLAGLLIALLPGRLYLHTLAVAGPPTLYYPPVSPRQAIQRLVDGVGRLRDGAFSAAHARTVTAIRAAAHLPPLHGAVDAYPDDQALLLASDADFRPRPVFQSYMAYTPRLAHANAEALLGDRAPAWIVFRVAPIDGGLPALDDAPSWPLLLSGYQPVQNVGAMALLQRRLAPLPWRLEPIGRVETHSEAVVDVPSSADGPIWARIDIAETRGDVLRRTLLAAPQAFLAVTYRDGQERRWRIVAGLARDGFLLSPVVETTADFIQLAVQPTQAVRAHEVAALRVLGASVGPRAVALEFFRLIIDPTGAESASHPAS